MNTLVKEVIPLSETDCFTVFRRKKSEFSFPLHYHEELEINLIINAKGIKRFVGDSEEEIQTDTELVFLGSNISHTWYKEQCNNVTEITVQFKKDLFPENLLQKRQLGLIRGLFENGRRGILFTEEIAMTLSADLIALKDKTGFEAVYSLMHILQKLSEVKDIRLLSQAVKSEDDEVTNRHRIDQFFEYLNRHYSKQLRIRDIAYALNISESLLSQIVKKHTGRTYIDLLNEIRVDHVARMLIGTTDTISEIAYCCGFCNFANFNRIFKKRKGCSPSRFRSMFQEIG